MNDFSTSTTIDGSPAEVFAAILDTRGWWNTTIAGATTRVGDEFRFEVSSLHRTRIRVTEVSPNQRIEWLVVENEFGFTTDQSEWVGDRIVFELQPTGDRTTVTLTQHGLNAEQECFDVCSNAWDFFVRDSLRQFAEHGQGMPESNTGQAEPATRARVEPRRSTNRQHPTRPNPRTRPRPFAAARRRRADPPRRLRWRRETAPGGPSQRVVAIRPISTSAMLRCSED